MKLCKLLILCGTLLLAAALLGQGPRLVAAQLDASIGPHAENIVETIGQQMWRRNLQQEAIAAGNGRPPAWRSRFDPIYRRSYIAPAVAENSCDSKQKCTGAIVGMSYPYEEYIMDPTVTAGTQPQPVVRVWYPKGSWSPNSAFPGGALFYNYPFKTHPTKDTGNPISATSAALEYQVYFPSDFDFNKGERVELRRVGIGGMPYLLGVNPFNRHIIAYELWKGKGFGPPPKIRNYLQRLLPRSRAENQNFGSFSPHFLHES